MARNSGGATAPAPTTQAQATREPSRAIRVLLESQAARLSAALPRHMTPERIAEVVSLIIYRTPRLQECDTNSVFASVLQGSALGLNFDPKMGEAYLVPRWNKHIKGYECQFEPGYQGLRKLAMQSGEVVYIQARLVHVRDQFEYWYNPELHFLHRPHLGADRGPVTHAYCYSKLKSGDPLLEVMTADELEAIHRRSESYISARKYDKEEFGPWVTDRGEMEKKTVIKRACKSLPRSLELVEAIEADDRQYTGDDAGRVVVSGPPRRALTRSAEVARQLRGPAPEAVADPEPEPEPAFAEGTPGVIRTEAEEWVDDGADVDPDDLAGEAGVRG